MFTASITIRNKSGLHARPAGELANECKQYESYIEIVSDPDHVVNAKSIISLLSGGFRQNDTVTLQVTGADEEIAGPAIVAFIEQLEG